MPNLQQHHQKNQNHTHNSSKLIQNKENYIQIKDYTSKVGIGINRPIGLSEPELRVLDATQQRILMRQARIDGPRHQQAAEQRNRIEVPLAEQIGGVVGDVIVGQAAAALVSPRQHRGGEISLRLHIEERAEVEQIQKILHEAEVRFVVPVLLVGGGGGGFVIVVDVVVVVVVGFGVVGGGIGGGEVEALSGERELFGDGLGERRAELVELVDESYDGGFRAQDLFLLLVDRFALGDGFFHLSYAVELFAQRAEAFVD